MNKSASLDHPKRGVWPRSADVLAPVITVRAATRAAVLTVLLATPVETAAVVLDGAPERHVRGLGPDSRGLEWRQPAVLDSFGDHVAFHRNANTVIVCDAKNPAPLRQYEVGPGRLEAMAVMHDQSIVWASLRGLVHQTTRERSTLSLATPELAISPGARQFARAVALSPDEQVLAVAPMQAPIQLLQLNGSARPVVLQDVALNLHAENLAFSADSRFIGASGGFVDGNVQGVHLQVWEAATGELCHQVVAEGMDEKAALTGMALSAGGLCAASRDAEDDAWLRVWTFTDGCAERHIEMGAPDPFTLDSATECAIDWNFTRDGRYLLVRFSPSYVRFYDTTNLELIATLILIGIHGDWVLATPSGEYDGTSAAIEWCNWYDDLKNAPLLSLPHMRRIGLLSHILNGTL